MQLISQLNEASDLPLSQVRDAMKKDKRVSKIFSKNLQLDEIPDLKEFIQTLKFYLLNNRNVLAHVSSRNGASPRVNNWSMKSLRQIRPDGLNQESLEELQREVADLFKDITSTQNTTYSNDTGQALWGWINQMRGYHNLHYAAVRELKTYPAIRPEKPIVVYRGLLFNEASMKEKPNYDGGMDVGAGLKFLRAVREGKRIADIQYDEPTKWYRSKDAALDDAHNGDETWRSERKKIRGELAFVVSMMVDPSKIIVDTSMIPKVTHEKPVVVVDGGKFTVRIVHKFTPDGEVDPLAGATEQSDTASALENLQTFAHIFKPPFAEPPSDDVTRGGWNATRVETFKELMDPAAQAKIIKATQNLLDYFNTYLKDLPDAELNDLLSHKNLGAASQVALSIRDIMQEKTAHPTEKDPRYSAHLNRMQHVPRHSLSAEDAWAGRKYSSLRGSIPALKMGEKTPRFRDWSTFSPIISLMHMAGIPVVKDLHQKGAAVQRAEILKTIDGFYQTFGLTKPAGQDAAVTEMEKMILTAERNASLLIKLWEIRHLLDRLKD
jgi:hypothetical protein